MGLNSKQAEMRVAVMSREEEENEEKEHGWRKRPIRVEREETLFSG